jgi:hypothetical protein
MVTATAEAKSYTAQVNKNVQIEEDCTLYHEGGDGFIVDDKHFGPGTEVRVKAGQILTSMGQASLCTSPPEEPTEQELGAPLKETLSGSAMIVERAINAPGHCLFTNDNDGPFIDFNRWLNYVDPRAYMSVAYFKEIARDLFDLHEGSEIEELKDEVARLTEMKEDPETFAKAVTAELAKYKKEKTDGAA